MRQLLHLQLKLLASLFQCTNLQPDTHQTTCDLKRIANNGKTFVLILKQIKFQAFVRPVSCISLMLYSSINDFGLLFGLTPLIVFIASTAGRVACDKHRCCIDDLYLLIFALGSCHQSCLFFLHVHQPTLQLTNLCLKGFYLWAAWPGGGPRLSTQLHMIHSLRCIAERTSVCLVPM